MASSARFSVANIKAKAMAKLGELARATQSGRQAEGQLPPGGEAVSVEKALNSRCTSDTDGNPMEDHWGMVDSSLRLSDTTIRDLVSRVRIPGFSEHTLDASVSGSTLTVLADSSLKGFQRDVMMVDAGMQQQAICLAAAALGVAVTIRNAGQEGTTVSPGRLATLRIGVTPMKPSYNGSLWCTGVPEGLTGNLPLPPRDGRMPLLAALNAVGTSGHPGRAADLKSVGQLLWAARGRTPHYYRSRPWGLTIPTWAGAQNLSAVGILTPTGAYSYVNERSGAPTHSLVRMPGDFATLHHKLCAQYSGCNSFVLLSRNEASARALWEIGYQLLNVLVQAHACEVAYRAMLLNESQQEAFLGSEIRKPVAVIGINLGEEIRLS